MGRRPICVAPTPQTHRLAPEPYAGTPVGWRSPLQPAVSRWLGSATLQLLPSYLSASRRARSVSRRLSRAKDPQGRWPVAAQDCWSASRCDRKPCKDGVTSRTRTRSEAPTTRLAAAQVTCRFCRRCRQFIQTSPGGWPICGPCECRRFGGVCYRRTAFKFPSEQYGALDIGFGHRIA